MRYILNNQFLLHISRVKKKVSNVNLVLVECVNICKLIPIMKIHAHNYIIIIIIIKPTQYLLLSYFKVD